MTEEKQSLTKNAEQFFLKILVLFIVFRPKIVQNFLIVIYYSYCLTVFHWMGGRILEMDLSLAPGFKLA